MKIRNGKYAQRKAISPIIATVLIIAVTLIAAVAIGGFVFGIFGSSSATANVSVTASNFAAASFVGGGPSGTVTCVSASPTGQYLTLTNSGTAAGTVTGLTISWGGATNSFTVPAGCDVGAAGSASATLYLEIASPELSTAASSGQTYSLTATMSNGAGLLYTGTWQ
jgi:flagellin-like protein